MRANLRNAGEHPNLLYSGIDPKVDANRYWTLSNAGAVFSTYDATFHFAPSDVDAGADPTVFIAQKYDAPTWSIPSAR